jgi:hypothetical protein
VVEQQLGRDNGSISYFESGETEKFWALLNQNMNQAIAAIRRVQRIGSGTEPYLR